MSFQKVKFHIQGPDGKPMEAEGEIIPVNAFTESQATYLLADGTTLSMRTIVMQVIRVVGKYDDEGNPAYFLKSHNVVAAVSPENLRQKPEGL
jgi:hypothetical protein